jgi:hypothetical protein
MPEQKALFLLEKHGKYTVGPRSIEKPGSLELLIKVYATALNPVDWKIQKFGLFYPDDVGVILCANSALKLTYLQFFHNRHIQPSLVAILQV